MPEVAVKVTNLTKKYNTFIALQDISFEIDKGTILGILGPNGAGKTTLIRSLVGVTKPNQGSISILGKDPFKNKWDARDLIGYMPQEPCLYEDLTVEENILFFARSKSKNISKIDLLNVLEFTELKDRAKSQVFTLSGGLKKRVSLACTAVSKPQIFFLDEPTAAIDPMLKIKSWKLFRNFAAEGKTILISTHLMDEAMLCDKLLILKGGKILAYDTPANIMKYGKASISILDNEIHEEVVQNTPQSIAQKLHTYGLREDINSIDIKTQNLEDIMVSLAENKQ